MNDRARLERYSRGFIDDNPDSVCMSDSTSVRLSDKQAVEVCIGAFRTGVCSNSWDNTDASVVCRQLNLGNNGGTLFPVGTCS